MAQLLVPTQNLQLQEGQVQPISISENQVYQSRSAVHAETEKIKQHSDQFFKFVQYHQDLRNKADTLHYQNEMQKDFNNILNEFSALQGKDAEDAREETEKKLSSIKQRIKEDTQNYQPIVQQLVGNFGEDLSIKAGSQMQQHILGENLKYATNEAKSSLTLAIDNSLKTYNTGKLDYTEMTQAVDSLASVMGIKQGSEQYKDMLLKAKTDLHYTAIDDLILDGRLGLASTFIKKYKDEMGRAEWNDLRIRLSKAQEQAAATAAVKNREYYAKNKTDKNGLNAADKEEMVIEWTKQYEAEGYNSKEARLRALGIVGKIERDLMQANNVRSRFDRDVISIAHTGLSDDQIKQLQLMNPLKAFDEIVQYVEQLTGNLGSFISTSNELSENEKKQLVGTILYKEGNINPMAYKKARDDMMRDPQAFNDRAYSFVDAITYLTAAYGINTLEAVELLSETNKMIEDEAYGKATKITNTIIGRMSTNAYGSPKDSYKRSVFQIIGQEKYFKQMRDIALSDPNRIIHMEKEFTNKIKKETDRVIAKQNDWFEDIEDDFGLDYNQFLNFLLKYNKQYSRFPDTEEEIYNYIKTTKDQYLME